MQPRIGKSKSYFNELGFRKTIDELVKQIAGLYLKDQIPWIVGYSGEKIALLVSSLCGKH